MLLIALDKSQPDGQKDTKILCFWQVWTERMNEQRLTILELSLEPKIMKEKRKVSRTAWQPIILILRSRQKYQKVIEILHNLFILVYSHVPAPL